MRQEVIYSLMAVAVAPVAAQAQDVKYHADLAEVSGSNEVQIFESSVVRLPKTLTNNQYDVNSFRIYMTPQGVPAGTVLKFTYTSTEEGAEPVVLRTLTVNAIAEEYALAEYNMFSFPARNIPENFPEAGIVKVTIQLPEGQEEAVNLQGGIKLLPGDNYVKNVLLKDFYAEVNDYLTSVGPNNQNGYKVDENYINDLLLFTDLSVAGNLEKTIENYEKFDILNGAAGKDEAGNLLASEELLKAYAELQAKIEGEKVQQDTENAINESLDEASEGWKDKADELNEILNDTENPVGDEQKDVIDEILEQIGSESTDATETEPAKPGSGLLGEIEDLEEYLDPANAENYDQETAEKKQAQVVAHTAYVNWLLEADKAAAAIDQYAAAIAAIAAPGDLTIDENGNYTKSGAGLANAQKTYFTEDYKRLEGKKLVLDKFLADAEANYKAVDGVYQFDEPKNVEVKVVENEVVKKTTGNFENIATLLGAEVQNPDETTGEQIGVLQNIAFLNYCTGLYEGNAADLFKDIVKATKKYDESLTLLEAKYTELSQAETLPVDFAKYLPTLRDLLYNEIMKGAADDPATTEVNERNLGILLITDEVKDAKSTGALISQTENHAFTGTKYDQWKEELNNLAFDNDSETIELVNGWNAKAANAYQRYVTYYNQLNGEDNASLLSQVNAFIPEEGGLASLDPKIQAEIKVIKDRIAETTKVLGQEVNKLKDGGADVDDLFTDDFAINDNTVWGDASSKWVDVAYGDAEGDKFYSKENIQKRIDNLTAMVNQFKDLDDLESRLQEASKNLNALTPAADADGNETAYNNPGYQATDFYGYSSNEAESYAKDIQNWVAAARAQLKKTIIDGEAGVSVVKNDDFKVDIDLYVDKTEDIENTDVDERVKPINYNYINEMVAKLEMATKNVHHDAVGMPWMANYQPAYDEEVPDLAASGSVYQAVAHYKDVRDGLADVNAAIQNVKDQVVNHGIYTAEGYDYKAKIEGWENEIKDLEAAVKDVSDKNKPLAAETPNRDEAHWTALNALNTGVGAVNFEDLLNRIQTQAADIDADKATYEGVVFKQSVRQLFEYIFGFNGADPDVKDDPNTPDDESTKPGYIDKVIAKYCDVDQYYRDLIGENDPNDVFGSVAHSSILGNATTLHAIFGTKEGADAPVFNSPLLNIIKAVTGGADEASWSDAIKHFKALRDESPLAPRAAQGWPGWPGYQEAILAEDTWQGVNDELLKLRDILDVFMNEGENVNNVVATKGTVEESLDGMKVMPSNLKLLKDYVDAIKKNKEGYDDLVKIKGRLASRVEEVLEDLNDKEHTPEGDDLIKLIEEKFKPIPVDHTPIIEDFYKNGTAYAQGSTSIRKDDVPGVDADGNPIMVDGKQIMVENPDQWEYHFLRDCILCINKLYNTFDNSFSGIIEDNNDAHFENHIVGAYDKAMLTYNKAIEILNKFEAPDDPTLLAAYEDAFETATLSIYQAPNKLRDARAKAEAHKDACTNKKDADGNPTPELYRPADVYDAENNQVVWGEKYEADAFTDKARIEQIEKDVIAALNTFVGMMDQAAKNRWDGIDDELQGYVDNADNTIKNGGDTFQFTFPVKDEETGEFVDHKYDADGKALYFASELKLISDAKDWSDMNLVIPADLISKLAEGNFEEFNKFDDLLVDEENEEDKALPTIPGSVKTKLNNAAYQDVTNRINTFNEENIERIQAMLAAAPDLGGQIRGVVSAEEYEALKKAARDAAKAEAEAAEKAFDEDVFDANFKLPVCFDPTPDADGNYWSYRTVLGDAKCQELLDKLLVDTDTEDEDVDGGVKALTVDAAQTLADTYNSEEQLPSYRGRVRIHQTRQEVLNLLNWETAGGKAIDDEITETMAKNQADVEYNHNWLAFGARLEKEANGYTEQVKDAEGNVTEEVAHEGILDLYVGPQFADNIEALKKNYEENKGINPNGRRSYGNISFLNSELDRIIRNAKVKEGGDLLEELLKLKDDYNQMVSAAGDAVTAFEATLPTEPTQEQLDELEAKKAYRDNLVKKYTIDEGIVDPADADGFTVEQQKQLDIDDNVEKLEAFNTAAGNTTTPFYLVDANTTADDDASYDDYLALEANVSFIKAQIAIDRGLMTAEQIAALSTGLIERLDKILAAQSKTIQGQELFNATNPAFEGTDAYKTADFGLLQYYLHADWATYQDQQLREKAQLQTLRENILARAANIMLYFDMFDTTLKAYESEDYTETEGQGGLKKFDTEWNENTDNDFTSKYEKALAQQEMASARNQRYNELLDQLADFKTNVLDKAKDDIKKYGLKVQDVDEDGNPVVDEEGNPVMVDLDVDALFEDIEKTRLPLLQIRLNALYLQKGGKFDEEVNLDHRQRGPVAYDLYLYGENRDGITADWLEQYGFTAYYNARRGQVTIPANAGLNYLNRAVADLVDQYTDQAADEEFQKAFDAFDDAFATVNDTEMRYKDKEALKAELFGGLVDVFDETEYETDDEGNLILDEETGEPIVKTPDTSFQKWMTDLFNEVHDQTPETMDAYKQKIQDFINALAVFEQKALDTRAGDIAGAGDDGLQPDGYVNIIDLQRMLNLVNNPATQAELDEKDFARCDLNADSFIDIVDLGIETDILIGGTQYLYNVDPDTNEPIFAARGEQVSETLRADVVSTEGKTQRIAISLSNVREYTGFQMDITLPQGMRLVGQSLSDRADGQQLYANEWSGKTRLVGFTMTKSAFQGNEGAVLYLDVETDETYKGGSVKYENIIFLTTKSQGVHFEMQGQTTGIMDRMINATKETIYNLGGLMMDGLKKGVNIIRGNNGKTEKVIKK